MEKVRIKLVKNEDSINVISNEESYYAKGISRKRVLEGEEYEYAYLTQEELSRLSRLVAKELKHSKKKKHNKESLNIK